MLTNAGFPWLTDVRKAMKCAFFAETADGGPGGMWMAIIFSRQLPRCRMARGRIGKALLVLNLTATSVIVEVVL